MATHSGREDPCSPQNPVKQWPQKLSSATGEVEGLACLQQGVEEAEPSRLSGCGSHAAGGWTDLWPVSLQLGA